MTPRAVWVLFAAASWFAAAPLASQAAERAVGLDAQGVDPAVALQSAGQLDLRDELGRPISPRLIEVQLKASRAAASCDAAFSSRLPAARAMARALEFWQGLKESLSLPWPRPLGHETWALPGRPSPRAVAPQRPDLAAAALACGFVRCSRTLLPCAFTGASLTLRC